MKQLNGIDTTKRNRVIRYVQTSEAEPSFAQSKAMRVALLMLSFVLVRVPRAVSNKERAACAPELLLFLPMEVCGVTDDSSFRSESAASCAELFKLETSRGLQLPLSCLEFLDLSSSELHMLDIVASS